MARRLLLSGCGCLLLVLATCFVLLALLVGHAFAAAAPAATPVQIELLPERRSFHDGPAAVGVFAQLSRRVSLAPAACPVLLAGTAVGGPLDIDDQMTLRLTLPDGTVRSLVHDFRSASHDRLVPAGPFDLTPMLLPGGMGVYTVEVLLEDLTPPTYGNGPIWLLGCAPVSSAASPLPAGAGDRALAGEATATPTAPRTATPASTPAAAALVMRSASLGGRRPLSVAPAMLALPLLLIVGVLLLRRRSRSRAAPTIAAPSAWQVDVYDTQTGQHASAILPPPPDDGTPPAGYWLCPDPLQLVDASSETVPPAVARIRSTPQGPQVVDPAGAPLGTSRVADRLNVRFRPARSAA